MAGCTTPFDLLKNKTESFGERLYVKASWREPWLNIVPRDVYPNGEGYTRTAFTIGRSEPASDEETWSEITPINGDTGSCAVTFNQVYAGFFQRSYKPEVFGLVGPLMCQDEFALGWQSQEFWAKYFRAIEKRNVKSLVNRVGNVYRNFVPKASANSSFTWHDGDASTSPAPAGPDLTDLDSDLPTSELTQEMLDYTAQTLNEEGAMDENTDGWITLGEDGPVYPLLIGQQASQKISLNNSEFRQDVNQAFQGMKDANPTIRRMGASLVIKNFRHIINLFPARWKLQGGALTRVPTFVMSTNASYATKGRVAIINPDWRDPSIAAYESVEVLHPMVCTHEILKPINAASGMKWTPQNYFGDWRFVTGPDALLALGCTGNDPLHKQGAHFAEFRGAFRPLFPEYGRMIVFKRCADSYDLITCS